MTTLTVTEVIKLAQIAAENTGFNEVVKSLYEKHMLTKQNTLTPLGHQTLTHIDFAVPPAVRGTITAGDLAMEIIEMMLDVDADFYTDGTSFDYFWHAVSSRLHDHGYAAPEHLRDHTQDIVDDFLDTDTSCYMAVITGKAIDLDSKTTMYTIEVVHKSTPAESIGELTFRLPSDKDEDVNVVIGNKEYNGSLNAMKHLLVWYMERGK